MFERLEEVINANLTYDYKFSVFNKALFNTLFNRNFTYQHQLSQFSLQCAKNNLLVSRKVDKPVCLILDCIVNSPHLLSLIDRHETFLIVNSNEIITSVVYPPAYTARTYLLNIDNIYKDLLLNTNQSEIAALFKPHEVIQTTSKLPVTQPSFFKRFF